MSESYYYRKVKSKTDQICLCCGCLIITGEEHYKIWTENSGKPDLFCSGCGPWIQKGYSFNDARLKKKEAEDQSAAELQKKQELYYPDQMCPYCGQPDCEECHEDCEEDS